jgi:hypothetical protein
MKEIAVTNLKANTLSRLLGEGGAPFIPFGITG